MKFEDPAVQATYEDYIKTRQELGRTKPVNLMDIGTIAAKYLKSKGELSKLDESEEINACTVKIDVNVDGEIQQWLLLFKNETHNHPTEIEPFGGAATCVGGAIRDPLSGRSYVYSAMRVTGAADPLKPVSETLKGKLPQRKIVTTAAKRLQLLRKSDRPCNRPGRRDLSRRLCCQKNGNRRGHRGGSGGECAQRASDRQ